MTIDQVLDWVDQVRPNSLSKAVKIGFINDIESKVQTDVLHRSTADPLVWCFSDTGEEVVAEKDYSKVGSYALASASMEPMFVLGEQFILYDEQSGNATLLVRDPFSRLYQWYVAAMVSSATGNNEVYQYDVAMFQKYMSEYSAWHLREGGH